MPARVRASTLRRRRTESGSASPGSSSARCRLRTRALRCTAGRQVADVVHLPRRRLSVQPISRTFPSPAATASSCSLRAAHGHAAGVAVARRHRSAFERHAVSPCADAPARMRGSPSQGGRHADRAPGARCRDRPAGAGAAGHDRQARWLVADLLPLDRRRTDPGPHRHCQSPERIPSFWSRSRPPRGSHRVDGGAARPGRALPSMARPPRRRSNIPGGSARYTFAGAAGQNLGLGISNLTLNPKVDATVYVYGPNGAQLAAYTCAASAGGCGGNVAPQSAGTHGVVVRPAAGDGRVRRHVVIGLRWSADRRRPRVAGFPRPARPNARLIIAGSAGQTLRLSWAAAAISGPSGRVLAYVNMPSGSTLGAVSIVNGAAGATTFPRCRRPAITRCSSIRWQEQR